MEKLINVNNVEVLLNSNGELKIDNKPIYIFKNKGYNVCTIKSKTYYIHRLVAETFIPNPENKRVVNHLNLIKDDNRVENLEWTTYSGNMKHYHENKPEKIKYNQGERHARSILTTENVIKIREIALNKEYTQKEIALKYNVSQTLINLIINKRKWTHV